MTIKSSQLQIGQVELSENGEELITILNNSTVVCIYDTKLMISGICHYLYPSENYARSKIKNPQSNPFVYGDFAIPTLLGLFKKKGSDKNNLEISVLGSSVISSAELSNNTSTENILCAERWIEKFGLKLKQKKTGLPEGMQVRVSSRIGGIFLKHLNSNSTSELDSNPISSQKTIQKVNDFKIVPPKENIAVRPSPVQSNTASNISVKSNSSQSLSSVLKQPTTQNSNTSRSSTSFSTTNSSAKSTPISSTTPSSPVSINRNNLNTDQTQSTKRDDKIRVLIVDDSKTIRNLLTSILESSPQMQIVGQAADAFEAETLRTKLRPDVMTLDIHMPEKDGVTYLDEVLNKDPMPIVMVSDLSLKEASPVMKALELGAFDYFQKPAASELAILAPELINIIKAAYEGREKFKKQFSEKKKKQTLLTNKKNISPSSIIADLSLKMIAIGASTGGPEAIRKVIGDFPEKTPPIVIVQHMPAKFTKTFADSLNQTCRIKVKEAEHGDVLENSTAYIAPGGFQMSISESKGKFIITINDDPPMNRFKPSVDYTFNSIEKLEHKGQINAAILTGMGSDGAYGILGLRRKGCFTIAQDEATCVVYGMPRAAVEYNGVDISLPLEQIAESLCSGRKKSTQSA